MKKKLIAAAAAAAALLSSCAAAESSADEDSKNPFFKALYRNADNKAEAVSDHSRLSAEKHGYGQGVQKDNENRPVGAVEFNTEFGKYNASAIGDKDSKTVRLTFDQGYENGYTAKILDTLKAKNVKATFFVLDDYARRNPELVKRMIDEGHIVGNHSVTHRSMPSLSADECREEVMGLHKYILDEFGYEMSEFRPPMGEYSELSLAVTSECGYSTLLWSYAYADWDPNAQPDPGEALKKLKDNLHNGAVYLLHSVSSTNEAILADFIDLTRDKGYEFESLD